MSNQTILDLNSSNQSPKFVVFESCNITEMFPVLFEKKHFRTVEKGGKTLECWVEKSGLSEDEFKSLVIAHPEIFPQVESMTQYAGEKGTVRVKINTIQPGAWYGRGGSHVRDVKSILKANVFLDIIEVEKPAKPKESSEQGIFFNESAEDILRGRMSDAAGGFVRLVFQKRMELPLFRSITVIGNLVSIDTPKPGAWIGKGGQGLIKQMITEGGITGFRINASDSDESIKQYLSEQSLILQDARPSARACRLLTTAARKQRDVLCFGRDIYFITQEISKSIKDLLRLLDRNFSEREQDIEILAEPIPEVFGREMDNYLCEAFDMRKNPLMPETRREKVRMIVI